MHITSMSAPPVQNRSGTLKIRLTILCAKNLSKKEFFRLPDPFAKVCVDGSGQCYSTETCKATLDPKWNQHYDLFVSKGDGISISVWNRRKVSKKTSTGFLGCIKLNPSVIHRLKDTGYQRLELTKGGYEDSEQIRGQIVISLMSRDGRGFGSQNAVVDTDGNLASPDDLPEGWEKRFATNGRTYFVNHVSRTTHWDRPTLPAAACITEQDSPSNRDSVFHYGNIVFSNPSAVPRVQDDEVASSSQSSTGRESQSNQTTVGSPERNGSAARASESRRAEASRRRSERHRQFLERDRLHQLIEFPSGYEMRTTQQGQVYYYNTLMGTSTWHDPRVPRDLEDFDPEELGDLPSGWELRYTPNRRPYYLNHIKRTTQFTDPRLSYRNVLNNILRTRNTSQEGQSTMQSPEEEAPPPILIAPTGDTPLSLSPQVPSAPQVTPTEDRLNSDLPLPADAALPPPAPPPLASTNGVAPTNHLENVLANGNASLHPSRPAENTETKETPPRLEDIEYLPKYSRDLVAKLKQLRAELQCLQPPSGHCRLDVPRKEIFEESFKQIMKLRPKDMRKRLMVKFRSEEGLDYGGVAREWLYLLSHEMLNPYYGLFQYSREDIYTLQINQDSSINPEHLSYFHFVGRVIGMAVFHGHYIDGGFTMPFYKMLLNKPILLSDIEAVDPELHRSLNWILENDITDVIDATFTFEHDSFGDLQQKELKAGGAVIQVTQENKKEYVRLYVHHRFMQGIEKQFHALQKGFNEVIPQNLLRPFDERELELIIGGLGKIDLDDWKKNPRLKHCTPETPVVVWFWKIVDSYSEEMRARLLQFVTGSSRVPLQGFKALQGSTGAAGPRLFTIHVIDAPKDNLPKAHTCFNRIDIPPYESYEKLYEKLTQAVEETCGFAVE